MNKIRGILVGLTVGALLIVLPMVGNAAQLSRGSSSVVLAIYQSSYVTQQENFTVSMKVASTTGIQFVYFTFCQLSSPVCYLPVTMTLHNTNWYVGTTKPMSSYHGMVPGVKAGYNITIVYSNNQNVTEPTVPNPFTNLTITTSVTGEYMFEMTVNNPVFGLHGVVDDLATGAPIPGATVTLSPGNNTTTTTSPTGSYTFARLLNGSYTIAVWERGYRNVSATVTIAGGDTFKNISMVNASSSPNPRGPGGLAGFFSSLTVASLLGTVAVAVGIVVLGVFLSLRRRKRRVTPDVRDRPEASESSSPAHK